MSWLLISCSIRPNHEKHYTVFGENYASFARQKICGTRMGFVDGRREAVRLCVDPLSMRTLVDPVEFHVDHNDPQPTDVPCRRRRIESGPNLDQLSSIKPSTLRGLARLWGFRPVSVIPPWITLPSGPLPVAPPGSWKTSACLVAGIRTNREIFFGVGRKNDFSISRFVVSNLPSW